MNEAYFSNIFNSVYLEIFLVVFKQTNCKAFRMSLALLASAAAAMCNKYFLLHCPWCCRKLHKQEILHQDQVKDGDTEGNVAHLEDMINTYKILVGNRHGKIRLWVLGLDWRNY